MRQYISSIALMLMPLWIWGQTDTTVHRLQPVVVTATQHAVQRSDAPVVVDVVGSQEMERTAATNLAEGLQIGTGLRVENTCQNCGANELRINGLGGEYSQILIDSRPLCSALATVYLLEQLPTAMIDRVEVMRGGGSALYGSGSIAGVVNVITRDPLFNSASVGNLTRLVGGRSVDWSNQFGASVVNEGRSAGLFLYGSNRHRDAYDRDGDGYSELGLLRSRMIGAKGFLRTGQYGKIGAEYHNLYEYRRGGDCLDLPSPMAHISEGGEHDIHTGSLRWDLLPADGLSQLSLFAAGQYVDRQSYYGEREDSDPIGMAYGYTTSLTTSEGLRYSRQFARLLFMPATLTVGLEHSFDHLTDRNLHSTDTLRQQLHTGSAYLQSEWNTYQWTLLAGMRVDKHTMVSHPVATPRLSLRYAPTDHLVLRAGYGSGFRAPQVFDDDLHAGAVQGELYKIENAADLRMERSHSLTASADLCFHIGTVDFDLLTEVFYTRILDAFTLIWLYDSPSDGYRHYERRNADGASVGGINLQLEVQPLPVLQVKAGGTLQTGVYSGQGLEYAEGQYERHIERSPQLYGYVDVEYRPFQRLILSARGTFTGSMLVYHAVEDDVLPVLTPSFFDLSLQASYRWRVGEKVDVELQAGVQNLFDAYQRDFDSGPERDSKYIYGSLLPRTLFAGVKCSL